MQLLKKHTLDEAKDKIDYQGRQCDRIEAKLLKGYNDRDSVRINGIPENPNVGEHGRRMFESKKESIEKNTKISTAKGAYVSESDISIAHRRLRENIIQEL